MDALTKVCAAQVTPGLLIPYRAELPSCDTALDFEGPFKQACLQCNRIPCSEC
jgi:hypothetical protein